MPTLPLYWLGIYWHLKMDDTVISCSSLRFSVEEIYDAMGYGGNVPDRPVSELVNSIWNRVRETITPHFYYQIFDCEILSDKVYIQNTIFETGKVIARSLRKSKQIAVFVATAGQEYENLVNEMKAEDDSVSLFILYSIGTCLVESTGDYMEEILKKEIGDNNHTNRFSPGYCGWNVEEQKKLFSLLPQGVCDVRLSDSCLMHPIKSISGFIGIGEGVTTKVYSCHICTMKNCFMRKTKRKA